MTRKELKLRAKNALKQGSYWTGYGVNITNAFINEIANTILSMFFSFGMLGIIFQISLDATNNLTTVNSPENLLDFVLRMFSHLKALFLMFAIMSIFTVIIRILLSNVLKTGQMLWFSRNREQAGPARFPLLFNGFKRGKYGDVVKGTAWRDFWLLIWRSPNFVATIVIFVLYFSLAERTLEIYVNNINSYNIESIMIDELGNYFLLLLILLILFAIISLVFAVIYYIKYYSYRAVDWILADNPNIDHRRALNLSKQMTKGYKGKWFVLDLSFIGWGLLLLLTFPVMFFTAPLLETYTMATHAEFYAMLRNEAVFKGMVTMEELGFVAVEQIADQQPISATDFYQEQINQDQGFTQN